MQAATVYYDVATQELAVTTYCTPSSLSTTEVVLDLCNLKPPISSPGNLISLWKETVLVVSQRDDMLWIVDISTRKVTAQFQANFTCFATAHYVVSGLVDMHFCYYSTRPLPRLRRGSKSNTGYCISHQERYSIDRVLWQDKQLQTASYYAH